VLLYPKRGALLNPGATKRKTKPWGFINPEIFREAPFHYPHEVRETLYKGVKLLKGGFKKNNLRPVINKGNNQRFGKNTRSKIMC